MSQSICILITGAGSGLGRGLSIALASSGHRIVVTDVDLAAARQTADAIADRGGQARAMQLDVTRQAAAEELVARLDEPVGGLINNAGLQVVARLEEFSQDQWDRLIDVMLKGTCIVTRAVLPGMRQAGFGRIVNIGSIHSVVASRFKSAYVAAKHGLLGFAKTVALETADADITINTVSPAYILTPLVKNQIAAQAKTHGISEDEVIERIMLQPMPKKQFITEEEVAAAVQFFLSREARNVTGQNLVIDGGWTVQ